jgi:ketosteroid isomerase-like protein
MSSNAEPGTTAAQIIQLERDALDRWGNGDTGGFLELYATNISYFDPLTERRIDGLATLADYYRPWAGSIYIPRFELLNPDVVVDGNIALLTYNLVNYVQDANGDEAVGSRWNSTTVYQRRGNAWKVIHSHWSVTRHKAIPEMTAPASDGLPS